MNHTENKPGRITRLGRILVLGITAFLIFQLISLDLSWPRQTVLGILAILCGLIANRLSASRTVTIALMIMSMVATFRYGWWRMHILVDFFSDESNQRINLDTAFILLLISAELYTILIMLLGYMQTAWPLNRRPIPLPNDDSQWPHVDVLIPTYNEPLALVRYTALAAINIDYPPEKLHVYILDDGTRDDFRQFAAEAGVGYVTRTEHNHAKAGNINHALTTMDSPYVAIFDCDHVPTRSFLQMTLGWMLADADLGMLQTPHHFYSPDPFERNLLQYKTIPNEAELFYGIVQDGNDFWNATFFCGSCALIRRSALEEVGGIATETVTEDAHTSLRMQKKGYNTAYINIPQAAGLATESLAAHVGQRIRWARGMIQILRTDNPLFGGGLKFTQRLCYFNAMVHFLYSVPRLVFLGAPLVYLLLGRTIIPGYWVAILVYALPHLVLSSLTNSRIQGRHRHSFWNEIYESVLAPYILAPTLLALVNPKLGKFNVTSKGNTTGETQFDRKIATPTRWLLFLNFCGLVAVPYRLFVTDPQHPGAVIMNMVWVLFNIVILGVAAAVAHEQKQRRGTVRIEAKLPVKLTMAGGHYIQTVTTDMSVGGASIKVPSNVGISSGDLIRVAFPSNTGTEEIRAQAVGMNGQILRVAFLLDTIAEQEILTRALYSRADAWLDSSELKEVDRPLISLYRVIVLSTYGINQVCRSIFPEKRPAKKLIRAKIASILLIAFLATRATQSSASEAPQAAAPGFASIGNESPGPAKADGRRSQAGQPVPLDTIAEASSADAGETHQVVDLKEAGMKSEIDMRGPHSYYSVHFTLSHQLVPKEGTLHLDYGIDSGLDQQSTSLQISLNGTPIATLRPGQNPPNENGISRAAVSVPGLLLVRNNTLTFEFIGSGILERDDHARDHTLCRLLPSTTIDIVGDRLRLENDLSQLPLPLLDSELQSTTTIPFVFLSRPTPTMLQAAGVLASWFGVMSESSPARFTASLAEIPRGNAVILASDRSLLPGALQIASGHGPVAALRNNPSDPYGTLLVLTGDDENDVLAIARKISLLSKTRTKDPTADADLSGDTAESPDLVLPAVRKKGDAPRWLPISKSAPLASCASEGALQTDGSSPVPVYLHLPPDLYLGERRNLELHVNYRYNARLVAAGSALRVVANGRMISEIPLAPGPGMISRQRVIQLPRADIQPFGNTLLFNFDFVPANQDSAATAVLSGEILCNSSLDSSGFASWARMPNLALFGDAGFPFTSFADLSQTVMVLPASPNASEIGLYLSLMGRFGSQTGYPALRVTVEGPGSTLSADRDYLILGTGVDQPAFSSVSPSLPATMDESGVHVQPERGFLADLTYLQTESSRTLARMLGRADIETPISEDVEPADALIEEFKSPSSDHRSIVAIMLLKSSSADQLSAALTDASPTSHLKRSLSLLRHTTFANYTAIVRPYHTGNISPYAAMRMYLTRYFVLVLMLVLALSLLCARYVYDWMAGHAQKRLKLADPTRQRN